MAMYQIGHRGEEIKQAQKKLRALGLFNYKNDTGFYGPKTEKAIREYQRTRGIKVDGILGPRTKNMLDNEDYARTLITSPNIKGTPHEQILKQLYGTGNHAINLGKGMTVTPDDINQYYQNLDNEIAPYYPAQKAADPMSVVRESEFNNSQQ